ncbi:transposase [Streptacidiphilus sp. BW17]|uniref:transposase n=1 Tax=Streptacidiphilus sp. BW17 TaxID=3156274 RepID=UPI0035168E07
MLQFLLGLSDRDAAEAVRCRVDFKYALCLELDDPGFHHSVLSDFRERLVQDGRADRLLDLALARLKEAGLVRERTTQRTDSTHVLAAVRDLTRLELVTEAARAALEEAARTAGHLLTGLVDEDWCRRYGRQVRLGKNPTRPKTRILAASNDACRLLERLHQHGLGYRPGPQAEALRRVVVQNYYRDAAGHLRWRTAEDGGLPPSAAAIVSPYDTTARYVRHGHIIRWKGFAATSPRHAPRAAALRPGDAAWIRQHDEVRRRHRGQEDHSHRSQSRDRRRRTACPWTAEAVRRRARGERDRSARLPR